MAIEVKNNKVVGNSNNLKSKLFKFKNLMKLSKSSRHSIQGSNIIGLSPVLILKTIGLFKISTSIAIRANNNKIADDNILELNFI